MENLTKEQKLELLAKELIWVCDKKYTDKELNEALYKDSFRELMCFGVKAKALLNS